MKALFRLSKMIAPLIPIMAAAIVLGVLGFFCAIGIPVYASLLFFIKLPLILLPIFGVLRGVLHYAEQYCNHYIAFKLLARIRYIVFEKLRKLGPAKLDGREKGALISLITSDIELLEVFFAHTISPVFIAIFTCLGMCIFIAYFNLWLALLAFISYCITGWFLPAFISGKSIKTGIIYRKEFSDLNSFLLDSLRGITQSLLYGNGQKQLEQIKNKSIDLEKGRYKLSKIEGFISAISGLCVTLCSIAMLFTSLFLYAKGIIAFEAVIICTVAMFSSFGPVIAVANLGASLSQTIAAADRVIALLDEKPLVEEVLNNTNIEFCGANAENVSFSYSKKDGIIKNVLKNINVDFPKNSIIGIKGTSGCGKSTLLKLFMYFYKPDSGNVKISNTSMEKINTENLREIESLVTQETVLFRDTIENNIKIANLNASSEEVQEACKKAALHDFICSLPNGYNTQVSELGDNFSGGERQRLGLARTFLHKSDFILLDEPTSNLDSYNERLVMDAVKAEAEGKTVIIVSHREKSFIHAEKIYNLENKGR